MNLWFVSSDAPVKVAKQPNSASPIALRSRGEWGLAGSVLEVGEAQRLRVMLLYSRYSLKPTAPYSRPVPLDL